VATRSWQVPSPVHSTPPPHAWPSPPPRRRNRWRWGVIAGVTAVAVVAATVVGIRVATTSGEDHRAAAPASSTTTPPPPVAALSANDTGAVGIITDDPTCVPWRSASEPWSEKSPLSKWDPNSPDSPINIPASAWTPEQRDAMDKSGTTLRDIATKTVPLAQATPHRVMRELYEQFIAYARAYSDSLTNYFPQLDVKLGVAAETSLNALVSTCNAIGDGAAVARSVLVSPEPGPTQPAPPQDPANPHRFISTADKTTCGEWSTVDQKFDDTPAVKDWKKFDGKVPIGQWSPQQKAVADALGPLALTNADDIVRVAGRSSNPTIQDFAGFAAVYQRAFSKSLPTYGAHDGQLRTVAAGVRAMITAACSAVGV
jgi:hypothetical protein